jgi:hypothetical protein
MPIGHDFRGDVNGRLEDPTNQQTPESCPSSRNAHDDNGFTFAKLQIQGAGADVLCKYFCSSPCKILDSAPSVVINSAALVNSPDRD